jgi:hypothetical protein
MKRILLAVLLLSLWLNPLWSLPSTPVASAWPLCLSESEWAALEDQVWAETQKTVEEAVLAAVEAAVVPYQKKIDTLELTVQARDRQILWLKVGIGVSIGGAGIVLVWAALK